MCLKGPGVAVVVEPDLLTGLLPLYHGAFSLIISIHHKLDSKINMYPMLTAHGHYYSSDDRKRSFSEGPTSWWKGQGKYTNTLHTGHSTTTTYTV